jgi:hypothetical protein
VTARKGGRVRKRTIRIWNGMRRRRRRKRNETRRKRIKR